MAKTAKRLVSESRTQLIDCRPLLHIALFSTGTSPFPPEPRSPPQHRSDPIRPMRGILGGHWTQFCGRECQAVISQRSISLEVDPACIID